jgi:acyl carrier protein
LDSEEKPVRTDSDQRLRQIIAEHLSVDEALVTPDANFVDDLDADSVDIVELIVALEDEFGVSFTADEAARVRTLRAAAMCLGRTEAAA